MKIEVLRNVRALLENPEHCAKYVYARDAAGKEVNPCSDEAVSFCLEGSVQKICSESGLYRYFAKKVIYEAIGMGSEFDSVSIFNDAPETTHADVLAVLDFAISIEARR